MALFDTDDANNSDFGWLQPNEDQPPAPRQSVLYIPPPALADDDNAVESWVEKYDGRSESEWTAIDEQVRVSVALLLQQKPHDWTRIAAVMIDEPFWGAVQTLYNNDAPEGPSFHPCSTSDAAYGRRIQTMQRVLVNVAAVVRGLPSADKVRVWVNYSEPEARWIKEDDESEVIHCPARLNDWYMDVVSIDVYGKPIAGIQHYYDHLFEERPTAYQQLALIPGTYSMGDPDDPNNAFAPGNVAGYLAGFFDYADTMNRSCSLVIGRVGVTRSADGCPIWMVAGFWGEYGIRDGRAPIFHSNSESILQTWHTRFQLPQWDGLLGRVEVFDMPTGVISGWAVDRTLPDMPPAVDVWLFSLDPQNSTPPIYLGGTEPTQQRSDVEAGTGISLAGFTFTIPANYRQVSGCHEYTMYAVARPPGAGNAVLGSKQTGCP